ncbi:MAG: metal ABC transporter permease, partial [Planctomycetes bacterium]|nr:metal ABC transporter permease [Planctomycetota bacterium]
RRMAYFGDTMAHSALLGVALALLIQVAPAIGVFAVAAVLTPPDPVTQMLMALPMLVLFSLGLLLMWQAERRKKRAAGAVPAVQQSGA